jgi:hypothetical protein
MIPQDPIILLSFINTQLRDNYKNIEALKDGLDISADEMSAIIEKLKSVGYEYNPANNQFV